MYEQQVALGAKWLDHKVGPGWELKIDLNALDMSQCSTCIIGQTFDIEDVSGQTGLYSSIVQGQDHLLGFTLPDEAEVNDDGEFRISEHEDRCWGELDFEDEGDCPHWQGLREAWVAEIKQRLDAGISIAN